MHASRLNSVMDVIVLATRGREGRLGVRGRSCWAGVGGRAYWAGVAGSPRNMALVVAASTAMVVAQPVALETSSAVIGKR